MRNKKEKKKKDMGLRRMQTTRTKTTKKMRKISTLNLKMAKSKNSRKRTKKPNSKPKSKPQPKPPKQGSLRKSIPRPHFTQGHRPSGPPNPSTACPDWQTYAPSP